MSESLRLTGTKTVFNKAERSEDSYFIKLPSELVYYVHVPGYKPEYNYLYSVIVDYYNVDEGYAYPNELQVCRKYGKKDVKTVRKHLNVLERLGLIGIYKPWGSKKIYVPFEPLPKDVLFKEVPEAKASYDAFLQRGQEEKERKLANEEMPAALKEKLLQRIGKTGSTNKSDIPY